MANAEEHQNGAYAPLGSGADEEAGGANLAKLGDAETSTLSAFPGSIKYLIWNEFCERFCFYGMKTILALYLVQHLRLSENESTELVHLFIVACYATPILGAFISDCVWVRTLHSSSLTNFCLLLSISCFYFSRKNHGPLQQIFPVNFQCQCFQVLCKCSNLVLALVLDYMFSCQAAHLHNFVFVVVSRMFLVGIGFAVRLRL